MQVLRWGNSLAVRLPTAVVDALALKEGDDIVIHVVGQRAFDEMNEVDAEIWATDCPLAALQFQQHAGVKPMHPMSILARAYREEGFAGPKALPPPGAPEGDAR